ncbi:transporter [Thermotoga sp. RQ7]|uniref:queuosine precursor transporter n=1 Tax=Thermotoga sp. RQ7 TaxID=126738 RepID=UPI0005A364AF|nr:queuosine precursor transporter [Thermotoga sp. RQ7]AJG39988.1 transporter [Thermotoga sp. RQ7]MDK2785399.1 queuosine precursor transporter [Thermotoga sp.]
MEKLNERLILLTGIFVSALTISNVIAGKLVNIGPFLVPVAVLCYPITFAVTDIVSEVYGKRTAQKVVWTGFFTSLILVIYSQIAALYPPASIFEGNEAFVKVFGATPRIVLASILAYVLSQSHDVWAFHFWKRITGGSHLWLRNNLSTMVSQFIDTLVFITVAFAGTVPGTALSQMVFSQYAVKLIIAAIDTPFVYLGVKLVSGRWVVKEGS